jgi:hypothetical protein
MSTTHAHPHAHESYDHVHGGPPVLDIGGDIGAMLALLDDAYVGTELFVRNIEAGTQTHTGVWRRHLGDDLVAAAVFLELTEGTYVLLGEEWTEHEPVRIQGGHLTELDLRTRRVA